nr:probable glutathione S-transferase GSTU6 isoform X2 [Oryza sativa Japonica Group]
MKLTGYPPSDKHIYSIFLRSSSSTTKHKPKHHLTTSKLRIPRDRATVQPEINQRMAGEGDDQLKLLGLWVSPYTHRVKLALSFKGLSYEYVEEDLSNKSELLLSTNPVHKKVPVLIHNGKPICESQVIVQYLDEEFPNSGVSLLPSDSYDRAIARFWAAYINDKSSMGKTEEERAEALKQTLEAVANLETAFKECSKGKPFFGGDTVGYLDVSLGAMIGWMRAGEALHGRRTFDATRSPLLNAWMERFAALDAAKAAMPDNNKLVEFVRVRRAAAANN